MLVIEKQVTFCSKLLTCKALCDKEEQHAHTHYRGRSMIFKVGRGWADTKLVTKPSTFLKQLPNQQNIEDAIIHLVYFVTKKSEIKPGFG